MYTATNRQESLAGGGGSNGNETIYDDGDDDESDGGGVGGTPRKIPRLNRVRLRSSTVGQPFSTIGRPSFRVIGVTPVVVNGGDRDVPKILPDRGRFPIIPCPRSLIKLMRIFIARETGKLIDFPALHGRLVIDQLNARKYLNNIC